MKKILIASLTLLTVLIMMGCGGQEPQEATPANQIQKVETQPTTPSQQATSIPQSQTETTNQEPSPTATPRPTRVPPRVQSKELRLFPATETPQPKEPNPTVEPTAVALVAPNEPNPTATTAPQAQRVRIRAWVFRNNDAGENMQETGNWESLVDPNAVWRGHNAENDGGSMDLHSVFAPNSEEYVKMEKTVREHWQQATTSSPDFIVGEPKEDPFGIPQVAFSNKDDTMMRFSIEGTPLDWSHVLVFTFTEGKNRPVTEPHEYFGLTSGPDITEQGRFALHTFALLDHTYKNFDPEGKKPSDGPTYSHDDTTVTLFNDQSNIIETALIDLPDGDYNGGGPYNEKLLGPSVNLGFNLEPNGEPGLWWKKYEDITRRNPYVDAKTYHYPQHYIFLSWIVEDDEYGN